jgi:5-methyltetrahydrofolate--homocysteine methyltransferase
MKILVGGAPVTEEFCRKIGADFYSPDPQGAVEYLRTLT